MFTSTIVVNGLDEPHGLPEAHGVVDLEKRRDLNLVLGGAGR